LSEDSTAQAHCCRNSNSGTFQRPDFAARDAQPWQEYWRRAYELGNHGCAANKMTAAI
jgi:hypothetical protein